MSKTARAAVRRALARAVPVLIVAALLGVFSPSAVHAACSAPSLTIAGVPTTGASPSARAVAPKVAFVVRSGASVEVRATEVFDSSAGCDDHPTPVGCAPPPSEPGPAKDLSLVLIQGSRQWTLATGDASGSNPSISWQILLPGNLDNGPAELRLEGPTINTQTFVRLHVRT